jgi:release factor family 10
VPMNSLLWLRRAWTASARSGSGRRCATCWRPAPGSGWAIPPRSLPAARSAWWRRSRCPAGCRTGRRLRLGRTCGPCWWRCSAALPTRSWSWTSGIAWIFQLAGLRIDTLAESAVPGVRSRGFGGWYGLESYRVSERITQLARHHYRDTAAILSRAGRGSRQPLVVGGHQDTVPAFLAVLSGEVRERFIGSFVVDPHTLTPARVRELSAPVVADWVSQRETTASRPDPEPTPRRAHRGRAELLPCRGEPARGQCPGGARRRPHSRVRLPRVRHARVHARRMPASAAGGASRPGPARGDGRRHAG